MNGNNEFDEVIGTKKLPNETATIILGVFSILGCFCFGLPGIILGVISLMLHKQDRSVYLTDINGYKESLKTSKAGQICGIIGLSLSGLSATIFLLYFAYFAILINHTMKYT